MTQGSHTLKLPRSIKAAAARLARGDGVSLNHWTATGVAEKTGRWRRRRPCAATAEEQLRLLREAPGRPPAAEDRAS
jgi:hypothetical protein